MLSAWLPCGGKASWHAKFGRGRQKDISIILGFSGGLMALNDRLKLRSMVVGEKDDRVFISSEEAAIRVMEPDAENIWAPMGGEPVIVRLKEGTY